jgi:hypothetical protein
VSSFFPARSRNCPYRGLLSILVESERLSVEDVAFEGTSGIRSLELAGWRRLTAEMYAKVRELSESDPKLAWQRYRETRSEMFRSHPQSPLAPERKVSFREIEYFPYDPAWRLRVPPALISVESERRVIDVELPEGRLRFRRFATVSVEVSTLTLFSVEGYGGGLFLPFKDRTNGSGTYGGCRYLYDTIKGADLGAGPGSIILDFNFAYNPSCAYSRDWVCPLAPAENSLPFALEAGERAFT